LVSGHSSLAAIQQSVAVGSVVNFFAHPTNLRLDRTVAEAASRRD
jgi:hypothetical protein